MEIPPLSVWERDGARATFDGLVRDIADIDGAEIVRRLDRLSREQRLLVYRWTIRPETAERGPAGAP